MFRGAIIILGLFATELAAQPPMPKTNSPPKYVELPFDGNPEQMLSEFLKSKAGQEFFQQVLQSEEFKKLINQPQENLKNILGKHGADNEALRNLVERFLKENPVLPKGDPAKIDELLKKFGADVKDDKQLLEKLKMMKGLEKLLDADGNPKFGEPPPLPKFGDDLDALPNLNDFMEGDFSLDERFGEWLTDILKNEAIQRDLNEWFKDAPGLQDAVGDLVRSLQDPAANGNWLPKVPDFGAGKWSFDFKPPKMPFELGQLPKLPSIKMPQLPRLNLPMPNLGNFGLPRVPGFGGMPNMPNMPGAPNVSGGAEWVYIIFAILAAGLAWWFLRKLNWTSPSPRAHVAKLLKSLPTSITTRTQLRQAFDALAITRFGDKARPWNHRLVARQLGDATQSADAAQAFANLYEMARYTPGDDRLSPAEQGAVRDSLAVLTGGVA